ncbi:hypothetical protein JCM33374_g1348 [Metschnikowia sp. JCM 33374]|nr:hypothetical protein JCM33374_g1348 [Metschnikowia sp. JCM 33374]
MTTRILRFKKVHYYCIPLVAFVVWWGMLIAMMACWGAQGKPMYDFMEGQHQNPVYISDIGATNLNPLFISCVAVEMIFFDGTLIADYLLRKQRKLQPYVSDKQPKIAIVSIISGIIAQLGILMVSIFKTSTHQTVHLSMLGVFIGFAFVSCLCNILNTLIFGHFSERLTPNHDRVFFGKHRWSNIYIVSCLVKSVWTAIAGAFAIGFGASKSDTPAAVFEWVLAFWYGILLLIWSMELFPAAVKHYRIHHPEEYPEKFIDNHNSPSPHDDSSSTLKEEESGEHPV